MIAFQCLASLGFRKPRNEEHRSKEDGYDLELVLDGFRARHLNPGYPKQTYVGPPTLISPLHGPEVRTIDIVGFSLNFTISQTSLEQVEANVSFQQGENKATSLSRFLRKTQNERANLSHKHTIWWWENGKFNLGEIFVGSSHIHLIVGLFRLNHRTPSPELLIKKK